MASRFQSKLDAAGVQISDAIKAAIVKETEELKAKIAEAADDEATNAAIDTFATNLVSKFVGDIDSISSNVGGSTGGTTGNGGETQVP